MAAILNFRQFEAGDSTFFLLTSFIFNVWSLRSQKQPARRIVGGRCIWTPRGPRTIVLLIQSQNKVSWKMELYFPSNKVIFYYCYSHLNLNYNHRMYIYTINIKTFHNHLIPYNIQLFINELELPLI